LDQDGDKLLSTRQAPGRVRRRRARGRVLKSVNERLEQQNDEQMNQNVGSGGTFVETWWPFETDQALQTFEAEFDAPSQTVEVEDIFRREVVGGREVNRMTQSAASRVPLET